MFIKEYRNWVEYRKLPGLKEVDFHHADDESAGSFHDNMKQVKQRTIEALKDGYADPAIQYILFTHGQSTSRIGATSSRSVIRGVMRGKEATPYIDRKNSIQHGSVFVAALKNRNEKSDTD